jgi:hypothetical protein
MLSDLQQFVCLERQPQEGRIGHHRFDTERRCIRIQCVRLKPGRLTVFPSTVKSTFEIIGTVDHIFEFGRVRFVPRLQPSALRLFGRDRDMV